MSRTSLSKYAGLAQDERPMTPEERRRLRCRGWHEQGLASFEKGDVHDLLWDVIERNMDRLFGKRGS